MVQVWMSKLITDLKLCSNSFIEVLKYKNKITQLSFVIFKCQQGTKLGFWVFMEKILLKDPVCWHKMKWKIHIQYMFLVI